MATTEACFPSALCRQRVSPAAAFAVAATAAAVATSAVAAAAVACAADPFNKVNLQTR